MLLLIGKQVLKGEKVDGAFGTGKTLNSGLIVISIIFEIIIAINNIVLLVIIMYIVHPPHESDFRT